VAAAIIIAVAKGIDDSMRRYRSIKGAADKDGAEVVGAAATAATQQEADAAYEKARSRLAELQAEQKKLEATRAENELSNQAMAQASRGMMMPSMPLTNEQYARLEG